MKYNSARKYVTFDKDILDKLPKNMKDRIYKRYADKCKIDRREAYQWLINIDDALHGGIEIGSDDGDLIMLAAELAGRARVLASEQTSRGGISQTFNLFETLEALCFEYGVRYPLEFDRSQIQARICTASWWLRGLRVALNKKMEGSALESGLVSKRAGVYCSDDTLERRTAQRRRNLATLEKIKYMNTATGDVLTLADIAKAGTSNHENRRAELVTRVRGFEELANKYSHAAEFITVTCPSRMHAVLANGQSNPKYDGTKPDDAQKYLVACWSRVRALMAKKGVKFYGLRIAEPHHDATPHWHMILFYRKSETLKREIRWAFRLHFLADCHDEAGALENRVKFVAINKARGTASGYVLKYVLKNIGGLQDGEKSDESAIHTSESLYERVEAWAACWRVRQFQQIGGHYVSVWRELRRIDESKLDGKRPAFVKCWEAAQKVGDRKADFARFVEAMGGLDTPPRKSLYRVLVDVLTVDGKYGKALVLKPLGVCERFGFEVCANNRAEWLPV